MPYEYTDDGGSSESDYTKAKDVQSTPGACPPRQLEYRIYPEADFNELFAAPPANVLT